MSGRNCPHCNCNAEVIRFGATSRKRQRYRCNKTWASKPHPQVLAKRIWNGLTY